MSIPTSQQWLSQTAIGVFRPRSTQMKAIDEALKRYEQARTPDNLWKIRNALDDWKRSKGPNWAASDRNLPKGRNGIITLLSNELDRVADPRLHQITRFSMEELKALAFMASERKKVIARLFEGKEVTFRNSPRGAQQSVKDAAEKVKKTCESATSSLSGKGKKTSGESASDKIKEKLESLVTDFFSVEKVEQLGSLSFLVIDIIGKCGVSIAPVVGHIKDGYDLFTGWSKVGLALREKYSISQCAYAIDTGAPAAAFAGLKLCLTEEAKNEAASASIATTSFALKSGLALVDGGAISGPVVGAANALAALTLALYNLSTEYHATKGINEALAKGDLDIRLFKTYPLMGCYMLTSATFSDLIPIENFGTPGWMDYVENLKKRSFDGIYDLSTKLIESSPWKSRVCRSGR